MSFLWTKSASGFNSSSTAEQVTEGVDATGLTAIVTGATSGIGTETARVLALRGAHVVMAIRNTTAGEEMKQSLMKEIPNAKIDVMKLDLSSLASVREFTSEYISSGRPLNILVNNAGVMGIPFTLTKDNIEMQFATNYVGHFLLTVQLLDTMKKTASESGKEGRIVTLSSYLHKMSYSEGILFDKLNDPKAYKGLAAYGQSKLATLLFARELSKQLKEEGVNITVNALHPGLVSTNLLRDSKSLMSTAMRKFGSFLYKNVQQGAATTCYVALNPQVKGVTGEYFDNCNVASTSANGKNAELAKKLWGFTMNLIK